MEKGSTLPDSIREQFERLAQLKQIGRTRSVSYSILGKYLDKYGHTSRKIDQITNPLRGCLS